MEQNNNQDYRSEPGYQTFDKFSRFLGEHTPKPVLDGIEKIIDNMTLENLKAVSYGVMGTSALAMFYGYAADKPEPIVVGAICFMMGGAFERARSYTEKALENSETYTFDSELKH